MNRTLSMVGAVACALLLTACASGSLTSSDATSTAGSAGPATGSAAPASSRPSIAGPTLVVTVPELGTGPDAAAPGTVAPTTDLPSAASPAPDAAGATSAPAEAPAPAGEPATTAAAPPAAAPASPSGNGVNVSLANCDGCSVVATRSDVAAGRSAALVSTGSGRGLLLSVGSDGQVAGVIGVPYGAAFPAPADGVLPCAQGRCVVTGRQNDGRAILSAFELTDTGAWRDVSGDDAFPSATERSAVIDLDGELAIAVQDQGDAAAVWMLYTWGGDRYAVLGCAPDGDPPTSAAGIAASACLS
ncbi:hypothetical protein [Nakamurella sp.]|uniref:hypothetical protein n=1 Tax=Nakamurella sp. TaxID=1869182 RepID=UPI003B3ACF94